MTAHHPAVLAAAKVIYEDLNPDHSWCGDVHPGCVKDSIEEAARIVPAAFRALANQALTTCDKKFEFGGASHPCDACRGMAGAIGHEAQAIEEQYAATPEIEPMAPALTVRIYAEDGTLWADIPEMPGVYAASTDSSIPALLTSLKEAVVLWCKDNPQAPKFTKGTE